MMDDNADRQSFLRGMAMTGAALAGAGLEAHAPARKGRVALTADDRAVLTAALVAEALAVTTYAHITSGAPFFARLFPQDQAYLRTAHRQEMAHYRLIAGLLGKASPYTAFYYPRKMFVNAPTTLTTLVTLEEAFIAAYLVGVRVLSNSDLRVTAARIMGVESDHRTMTRVLAPGLDPADGGPLRSLAGIQGVAEAVDPASNNVFERTLGWTTISPALAALLPFVDRKAAARAGFDPTRHYVFTPFTPTVPSQRGMP